MTHASHLLLFFSVVFGVIVLPGLDMAFVMGSSLALGRRHGLAGVGGIVAGGFCLVALTTLGIGALVETLPSTFNVLLLCGALYLAWIGASLLKSDTALAVADVRGNGSVWRTFRRGALTCVMNPKAYLFLLAVFPQFLRPAYGTIWAQAAVLWLIIAVTQTGVYGAIALAAARARSSLLISPRAGRVASRIVGIVLIAVAMLTVCEDWRP
ncbi:MAG: LysE family translocator [Rhodanobacteraceae bacterium]